MTWSWVWSACPHSHREVSEMPILFRWALRPQCPMRRRKIVVCWARSSLRIGSNTSDFKTGPLVHGNHPGRVSARTGWPGINILWLGVRKKQTLDQTLAFPMGFFLQCQVIPVTSKLALLVHGNHPARHLALQGQCWNWMAWYQYTVTGCHVWPFRAPRCHLELKLKLTAGRKPQPAAVVTSWPPWPQPYLRRFGVGW